MASTTAHNNYQLSQQMLELPHLQDGNINYKILGNMLSATLLGEVLHASYVDHEYGKGTHVNFSNEAEWQFYYKENDVVVFRKRLPNSKIQSFLGRGVIDAPMADVVDYVHKFHNRLEWDNYLVQIEVCKEISENDWLLYMAHEAKQCFFKSRRDMFYYSRTAHVEKQYIQTSMSIKDKDYPHRPPYIRADIKPGSGWVIEKYEGSECSTLVSYLAHMDLKELPPVIMNRVLRRQPMAIHHIRKRLTAPSKLIIEPFSPSNSLLTRGSIIRGSVSSTTSQSTIPFEDSIPLGDFIQTNNEIPVQTDTPLPLYPWVKDQRVPTNGTGLTSAIENLTNGNSENKTDDDNQMVNGETEKHLNGKNVEKQLPDEQTQSHASFYISSNDRDTSYSQEEHVTLEHVISDASTWSTSVRSRSYTNSLPDFRNLKETSPSSGNDHNTSSLTTEEGNRTMKTKKIQVTADPVLSLKSQTLNNASQEFPSFSSWSYQKENK